MRSAHNAATPTSGLKWLEQDACEIHSVAWSLFAGSPCVHVALDAKKLGNPAEETESFLAVDARSGRATWLPIQVPLCVSHKHVGAGRGPSLAIQ